MDRRNEHRWAAVLLTCTALLAQSISVCSQTSHQPAAIPLPMTGVAEPQFQLNPLSEGDSLMAHQRYQAAIEAYRRAPRDSAEGWNKMGVAYQLMLNSDEAVRCYQNALKLNPKNASAMNNLGTVYVTLKNYSAAERSYRKALKIDPQIAVFHKNLGTALLAERKYKKGWEAYKAALAIDPMIFDHSGSFRVENPSSAQDRGAMNYYMARGCARAGMNDRAIEYLRMSLNEGFTNPKKIIADTEFAALLDFPAFLELLASQRLP